MNSAPRVGWPTDFTKITFVNKGIDFIDLPNIFRDNTVESIIPNYFENKEPLIICYKYSKPIRSTIFNFNKLLGDPSYKDSIFFKTQLFVNETLPPQKMNNFTRWFLAVYLFLQAQRDGGL